MRVLLVNYEYPPSGGGGGVFTKALEQELSDAGDAVEVVTADRGVVSASSTASLFLFPFSSLPELLRTVRKRDVEVINGHFTVPSSLFLPVVSRSFDVPLVVNAMGADIYAPTRYDLLRPVLDVVNYRYVLRFADRVVVPSTDMRDRLPHPVRSKCSVIPYFVDHRKFRPAEESGGGPLRILTVARLVERKNLETAIAAVASANDRGVDIEYRIGGAGPQRDTLERTVKRESVEDVVTFLGYLPEEEKIAEFREADVFLLPSHHEAFGIVFLEAMASGCPVVTSNVGGQTDIVTDSVGYTCDPEDTRAIADAIGAVASRHDEMGQKARARVEERYTEEVVVDQYRDLYEEVTDS